MAVRLDMTMSLDGFLAGPDDGPDEPMGRGGFRLFDRAGACSTGSRPGTSSSS